MSYDLFFKPAKGERKPSIDEFGNYFKERPHFIVKKGDVGYFNKDTGIHFAFNYSEGDPNKDVFASFNLNYMRPHVFGLEAEPEVRSFVEHFNCKIDDPQSGGMGQGKYSKEGFLKGWNLGNAFGYTVVAEKREGMDHLHTMPSKWIESVWRWNYSRMKRVEEMQRKKIDVYIPKLFIISVEGKISLMVSWPEAIPILIPTLTDYFMLLTKDKRNLFTSMDVVKDELEKFKVETEPMEHYVLDYKNPPESLVKVLESQDELSGKLKGVSIDMILDEELLKKAEEKKK